MTLWDGRFSQKPDELVAKFSESISFDQRLYAHDIEGSIAHVSMLGRCGIIPDDDGQCIINELNNIRREIESGSFQFDERYEDIHMNIESALLDRLGDIGAKIHTARSRNDQVATDTRLYLRDEIDQISGLLDRLKSNIVGVAEEYSHVIMPGFTHLQHAQPILFSHHLLAYVEMLHRDSCRLADCRKRVNQLPLGSGALAGTSLPIDRDFVATELRFDSVTQNSMDAVSDRDYIIEFLSTASIIVMHMSRLSEDIIYWVSQECSFIELSDTFCTGSSLMPQKKNPDVAELTRGKTGRVYGHLLSLLTMMKGLPLCYNRDMQEDKEPLFDTIDTVKLVLSVYAPMIKNIKVNEPVMKKAASDPFLMATDLAEWLVGENVPFRTAHKKVGTLVGYCQEQGISPDTLNLTQLKDLIPECNEECLSLFDPEKSIGSRNVAGGTSGEQVKKQIEFWKTELNVAY